MVVAVHIMPTRGYNAFLNIVLAMAQQQPNIRILLLANGDALPDVNLLPNISLLVCKPAIKNNLSLQYWYAFKLPGLLKKNKATHFISGAGLCCKGAKLYQYIWINSTSFLQKKSRHRQLGDYNKRRNFLKIYRQSVAVFTANSFMAGHLAANYALANPHIFFTGSPINPLFIPLPASKKEVLLNEMSNGNEYFFFEINAGSKQQAMAVLKAFSVFKKRLKSGMKLMLYLNNVSLKEAVADFHLYKYRQDVMLMQPAVAEPIHTFLAAAYAVIWLPADIDGQDTLAHAALQTGVALLAAEQPANKAQFGNAALLTATGYQALAENMMLLYKDENLHRRLIENGLKLMESNHVTIVAQRFWQTILAGLPQKAE